MMDAIKRAAIALCLSVAMAFAGAGAALASPETEAFVAKNAPAALSALDTAGASEQARAQRFAELMDRFSDMELIANFVLGRYARQLRADPALRARWNKAFRDYAVAVYQDQLDQYRGREIRVLGSQDSTINGRFYSVVNSQIILPGGEPFRVQWRLLRQGETYRVVDVAVRLGDATIWLAQQQRRDFEAELDRNGGSVERLIASVEQLTTNMRQRIAARERGQTG